MQQRLRLMAAGVPHPENWRDGAGDMVVVVGAITDCARPRGHSEKARSAMRLVIRIACACGVQVIVPAYDRWVEKPVCAICSSKEAK